MLESESILQQGTKKNDITIVASEISPVIPLRLLIDKIMGKVDKGIILLIQIAVDETIYKYKYPIN